MSKTLIKQLNQSERLVNFRGYDKRRIRQAETKAIRK